MKYITHAKPLGEVAPTKLSHGWPPLRLRLTLKAHSVCQKHDLGVRLQSSSLPDSLFFIMIAHLLLYSNLRYTSSSQI